MSAIKIVGPGLECANHSPYGFVEQHADDPLQQARSEFKIDEKIDLTSPVGHCVENPVVVEIFERTFAVNHVDPHDCPIQRYHTAKTFPNPFESYDKIGNQDILFSIANARAYAPWQELGITFDIGNKVEQMIGAVRKHPFFGMSGHRMTGLAAGLGGNARRPKSLEIVTGVIG